MLILTRKPGEGIVIGDGIEVTILSVDGDRVKIGIAAPADVLVLRTELRSELRAENQAAARNAREAGGMLRSVARTKVRPPEAS